MSTVGGLVVAIAIVIVLAAQEPARAVSNALPQNQEVCDPLADYFLGMEDYPEAIRLHLQVIKKHPNDALAHYHLGFAYGVMGEHRKELAQYRKAIELGLDDWDLFYNLGLLYLQSGNLHAAISVLNLATLIAPGQPKAHLNLGVAYERAGMLKQAEQEVLVALELAPEQADERNTLGAIYAQEGKFALAREEWTALVQSNPSYLPARQNLHILDRMEHKNEGHIPTQTLQTGARP